jgi:DNA-binding PadR family transcriptional regulator
LLADQPRHGYDLIREIEERTGGSYAPSPGVVYPTLTMLDEMGHIDEVKEEGARKRFAITDAGREFLAGKQEEVEALLARLSQLSETQGRSGAGPIKRSMVGLHMALREALASGRGRDDMVHDIAAILDEAARKIERLER